MPWLVERQEHITPQQLREGVNEMPDGEQVFFIPSPSTGLWAVRDKSSAADTAP